MADKLGGWIPEGKQRVFGTNFILDLLFILTFPTFS